MKILPNSFNKKGFQHKMVARDKNVAIYRRKPLEIGEAEHYEVIVIKEGKAFEAFGKSFEASEIYPSSEQWGTYGFTCTSKERAFEKMAELLGEKK